MKTEKFKSLAKRTFAFSCMFVLIGMTAHAQFSINGMGNATAVALRDPARQASTEVDAVLYNPAGTAFLQDGFHVSLNGLFAYQPLYSYSLLNDEAADVHDERIVNITPSAQLAWKKGRFSVSASFSDEGNMGRWTCARGTILYDAYLQALWQGLGLNSSLDELNDGFQSMNTLLALGGYNKELDVELDDAYRVGSADFVQSMHNYTTRLGATYAVNNDMSVYVGAKLNYLTRYTSILPQIQIYRASTKQSWEAASYFSSKAELLEQGTNAFVSNPELAEIYRDMANSVTEVKADAVTSSHSAMGVTPVVGCDYNWGRVNVGVKYEFQTIIDSEEWTGFKLPSNLSLGVDWTILDNLSMAFGGTAYFCTDDSYGLRGAKEPSSINGNVALSVSYSPVKNLLVSVGQSYENYSGFWPFVTSEDMEIPNRQRFATSLGGAYNITERLQVNLGGSIGYTPVIVNNDFTMNISNGESTTTVQCPVSYYTNMKYNVAMGVNYRF